MSRHDAMLSRAVGQLQEASDADRANRERGTHDLSFLVGINQWPQEIKSERDADDKPCLTVNALPQFVRNVTSALRQLNPAIRVLPADSAASDDVADIMSGLVRHIEYQSDAPSVYEAAAESAAGCGIGWFRIRADYCHGATFDQELLIERVHNPFAVFVDPAAKDPTRCDAQYMFIVEEVPREQFRKQFPGAVESPVTAEHKTEWHVSWGTPDTVTVAEYFWIEQEEIEIGLLPNGAVIERPPAPLQLVARRRAMIPRVKWAKITAHEVLEGPLDIPGRFIPVIAVTGEEWHIGEEVYRSGVIRFAKDPQQLYNYAISVNAEVNALQPKAPYMVTPRQIAGLETIWGQANNANRAYLVYNPDPSAPPPQRMTPPVSSQAALQQMQIAAEDIKRTTGIYAANLGEPGNETSGVAIRQRQMEGQLSNSIYADNMAKAVRQCGRVLVDMIPAIYDSYRVIRILSEDDQERMVEINQIMRTLTGDLVMNDLTAGKYDVRVDVGPTYHTRRQESSQGMMDFLRAFPQAAQVTADLVAKAQEWPDADQIAERLRKIMPPGVIEIEDMDPEQAAQMQQQAQMQAQMAQMQQQLAMQRAQLDLAETQAKIGKTEADTANRQADTRNSELDAADKQIDLALRTGQLNAVIQQAVESALMGVAAQQMQAMQAAQANGAPPPPY